MWHILLYYMCKSHLHLVSFLFVPALYYTLKFKDLLVTNKGRIKNQTVFSGNAHAQGKRRTFRTFAVENVYDISLVQQCLWLEQFCASILCLNNVSLILILLLH